MRGALRRPLPSPAALDGPQQCGIPCSGRFRPPSQKRRVPVRCANAHDAAGEATVGGNAPRISGWMPLLDFSDEVTLDGENLTAAEIKRLLAHSDGLALIRGKWSRSIMNG